MELNPNEEKGPKNTTALGHGPTNSTKLMSTHPMTTPTSHNGTPCWSEPNGRLKQDYGKRIIGGPQIQPG